MRFRPDPPDFSLNRLFLQSDGSRPRLRIGILADAAGIPRHARQVIADIGESNFSEVACVVTLQPPADGTGRTVPRSLAYEAYRRWISRAPAPPLDPVEPVDTGLDPARVESSSATVRTGSAGSQLPQEAIEYLRRLDLDVLLHLGSAELSGEVPDAARHGTWAFRAGDRRSYCGGPPMLWELIEDNPVTSVALRRLGEVPEAGLTLAEARFTTAETISAAENGYGPYWCTTHFVIQKLNELHRHGWAHVESLASPARTYEGRPRLRGEPTNTDMLRWLGPLAARATLRRVRTLARSASGRGTIQHWRLGLRRSDLPVYEERSPSAALQSFRWIDSPKGHFWADPHLLGHGGSQLLFFEDFDYVSRLGAIAVAEVTGDGTLRDARIVLQRPYHLSYPQVFEHEGEWWMVPESSESGAIELWRARSFPDDWVLEKRLVEIRAVDPTLVHDRGRWWLFATPMPVMGHFAQTYLWSADHLQGPWRLHQNGAVCSDASRARPAGRIIARDGRLVRPSQDCSGRYGRAIWFSEIEQLEQETYAERPLVRVSTSGIAGLIGLHTYSRSGNLEAVDGLYRSPKSVARP